MEWIAELIENLHIIKSAVFRKGGGGRSPFIILSSVSMLRRLFVCASGGKTRPARERSTLQRACQCCPASAAVSRPHCKAGFCSSCSSLPRPLCSVCFLDFFFFSCVLLEEAESPPPSAKKLQRLKFILTFQKCKKGGKGKTERGRERENRNLYPLLTKPRP